MEDCYNRVELCGQILTAPELSHTNHGELFYRFILSVPRLSGQSDDLPVITWGLLARQAAELETGDSFCAEGRVQSRVYLKVADGTALQRTAYEVSVMHMACREDFPAE